MRGHSLTTGLRKLNRHYQSEPAMLKPWLVTDELGEVTSGTHWIGLSSSTKKFTLNYMVFGTNPLVTPVASISVPFQIKFISSNRAFTVYTQGTLESIPFDGGVLPLYEVTTDGYSEVYTQVGEVTLTRENDSTWRLTSDYDLVMNWVEFTFSCSVTETIENLIVYIGYRKEY